MPSFISLTNISKLKIGVVSSTPERSASALYQGQGSISGLVREKGTPASHRVNLHVRPKGTLIASTWSGLDGKYTFSNIAKQYKYYIVCVDERGGATQYPALVQDMVQGNYDETITP